MTGGSHFWGKGYAYFIKLPNFKRFENKCKENLKLFEGKRNVGRKYQKLSKFIHSGASFFQTGPERISPEYKIGKFKQWGSEWKNVQNYVNVILAIEFEEDMKGVNIENCKLIINLGVEKPYRAILKRFLKI
jgi:hypothetical protein